MQLTIITINYNNIDGFIKTAESIKNQIYKEFEWIVIDGGSNDGFINKISSYRNLITNLVSEKDKGIYDAMNKGITLSSGKYLHFLNSGDVYHDDLVLKSIFTKENDCDYIYGNANFINQKKIIKKIYPLKLDMYFFFTDNICHQSLFFKKDLFDRFGLYNIQYKICSDWIFLLETIIRNNSSYKKYDLVVVDYDTTGVSSLNQDKNLYERRLYFAQNFKPFLSDYDELRTFKNDKLYSIAQKLKTRKFLFGFYLKIGELLQKLSK
ncbi:MAG: glycosyltransferase family 2 protein [Bacteroidales bacterium]|nr:glycosyltransferase family 2 protein [Bacteroidales bacterium]